MTNLKRVFLVMVVVMLLGVTVVCASDTIVIGPQDVTVGGNKVENNTTVDPTPTVIGSGSGTTGTSTYNNTTNLPQTGADDYAIISIIAVLGVVAVFAYKKINDYKNI